MSMRGISKGQINKNEIREQTCESKVRKCDKPSQRSRNTQGGVGMLCFG